MPTINKKTMITNTDQVEQDPQEAVTPLPLLHPRSSAKEIHHVTL